jgi:hypothetical protein
MTLSANAERLLNSWLSDTWHTPHVLDMNRFYKFVGQYAADHGHVLDESALLQKIIGILGISDHPDLIEIARERISLMYNILDFLKATGR